ncbi:MAG: alpha/beta hydrolase [Halioglobus sp.]
MTTLAAIRRGYVTVAGLRMHYRAAGDISSPTLLCLHQSPSSSAMYEPLMNCLADEFHLLAPDTPGFGSSDRLAGNIGDLEIVDYANAMHEFLQQLDVERCFIFGHHTGAGIAVQLEHDFPGTAIAIALSGPTLLSDDQKENLPALASPIEIKSDGSHLQKMWQRISAKDPQAPAQLVQREVQAAFACGDSYQASYLAITRQAFAEQLPAIKCPTLVYAGDHDPLYRAVEPTLALLSRGERASLTGGERTYVCERQVKPVAALLKEFFGRPDH